MKRIILGLILAVGMLSGWMLNDTYSYYNIQLPLTSDGGFTALTAPHDIIKNNQIQFYNDRVVINKQGITGAVFLDTQSMIPAFGKDATGLDIKPKDSNDIAIGDVVVYKPNWNKDLLIPHRVIAISSNDDGSKIFHVKGDNSQAIERITFDQIEYLQIGVIY
ncbi:MAG TPA: S26 family signal peptidase [Candidatus Nanoarchaeia archaeon]|nr:S26 family signal peptidase [Candidatus Nanoarchaeia archaeon]